MLRYFLLFTLFAAQAQAGAWPREKGKVFLSYSLEVNLDEASESYLTFYGEYGASAKLTLGVDIGGDEARMDKAIAFARLALPDGKKGAKQAIELGLGAAHGELAVRPGYSVGQEIEFAGYSGWFAIDNRVAYFGRDLGYWLETDLTFGLNVSARAKLILQAQSGTPPLQETYVRFAPSLVIERKPGRHLEFGITAGVLNSDKFALKVGAWRQF